MKNFKILHLKASHSYPDMENIPLISYAYCWFHPASHTNIDSKRLPVNDFPAYPYPLFLLHVSINSLYGRGQIANSINKFYPWILSILFKSESWPPAEVRSKNMFIFLQVIFCTDNFSEWSIFILSCVFNLKNFSSVSFLRIFLSELPAGIKSV